MKLWEMITTIRDMGGTMEDVRALMQAGIVEDDHEVANPPAESTEQPELVEKSVENVENSGELEALRLENAKLKGQLQTYNILHMSTRDMPDAAPADKAVQVGIDMIK